MAGFIGNVVEWYDFALYGYLAGVISPVFFPEASRAAGLIATYGIFAAGFIMRPLGAAVFGWFGDLYGRARTMQISVIMMAAPTLLLGLLPTYGPGWASGAGASGAGAAVPGRIGGWRVFILGHLPGRDRAR